MKRDMNVVRQIVNEIAESESEYFEGPFEVEREITKELLDYHLEIMEDVGIIEGRLIKAYGGIIVAYFLRLSWMGNDFYETFKNDSVWEKAKEITKEKGFEALGVPFDILIELGKQILKNTFS